MKTIRTIALLVAALALTACAQMGAGFHKATDANTARLAHYQDNMLLQADNDLAAINACYLHASGYKRVTGTQNAVVKVGEPSSPESCTVLAMGLRTQSNMLAAFAPFVGQALLARVPASPEEIVQSILKDGMKFALTRFGIDAVTKVVTTGQLAQAQVAQAGIEAASKPPLIIEPTIIEVPAATTP
jgi:hypothetical protein